MTAMVHIRSRSHATDLSLAALVDLVRAADAADLAYRVLGGQMVSLHLELAGVAGSVPERDTADSDAGVPRAVAEHPALERFIGQLTDLGYTQVSGDRFERSDDGAVIDLLVPGYQTRRRSNVAVGPIVATEAGGLSYALGQPPTVVTVAATLSDGRELAPFEAQLPSLAVALATKAFAWQDRRAPADALDIARLLHAAHSGGLGPDAFEHSASLRGGREIVQQAFRSPSHAGALAAYSTPVDRAHLAYLCREVAG